MIKLPLDQILFLNEFAKVLQPRLILLAGLIGRQFAFEFGEASF